MVAQFSCLANLFFVMHRLRYTWASLISFWMMFSFTVYLFMLSLRKKGVRRCRVSSCLWTRRKVYQLQRRQSRTAYVLAALDSSNKARKCCGKESRQKRKEYSNYCSNILKIITLAFIAVMTSTELQMLNDLQKHKGNIQFL